MTPTNRAKYLMAQDLAASFPRTGAEMPLRELVRAWQTWAVTHGDNLTIDGVYGPKTAAALWLRHKPTPAQVVEAVLAALKWAPVRYSMSTNTGLGESWLPDMERAPATGDCSDFAAHCLGIPKDQTGPTVALRPVWLGADAIASGAIGPTHPLTEARPGDLAVYAGRWERGERVAIGHVEVVVEAGGGRIITVGCASGNKPSAIARADKTALWKRKGAVVARPWWH